MKFIGSIMPNGFFVPVAEYAEAYQDFLSKPKKGDYKLEIKKSRETPTHNAIFYLLNQLYKNQELINDPEKFRAQVLCEIDFCHVFETEKGLIQSPRSLEYKNCDEIEAKEVLARIAILGEQMGVIDDKNRDHFLMKSASKL